MSLFLQVLDRWWCLASGEQLFPSRLPFDLQGKEVPPKVAEDYEADRQRLVAELEMARANNLEVICLDELVFSKHTIKRRTPALRNQQIKVSYDDIYVERAFSEDTARLLGDRWAPGIGVVGSGHDGCHVGRGRDCGRSHRQPCVGAAAWASGAPKQGPAVMARRFTKLL